MSRIGNGSIVRGKSGIGVAFNTTDTDPTTNITTTTGYFILVNISDNKEATEKTAAELTIAQFWEIIKNAGDLFQDISIESSHIEDLNAFAITLNVNDIEYHFTVDSIVQY